MNERFDAVVIGGGPSGSCCALRLADFGYRVALLEKSSEPKRQHVGESVPSSIRIVLAALRLTVPEEVVAPRPSSHLVFWGRMRGGIPWTVPPGETSLLVWRGPFDRFLRERARERGARSLPETAVRCVRNEPGMSVATLDGKRFEARVVIDASGRAGILARHHRRKERRFRTLALTGHFETTETSPPTLLEAFEDGWVWSAPLENGLRDVTVMVDPRRDVEREVLFVSSLERAKHVSRLVSGSRRRGPLRGIDATPYDAVRTCGPDFLLVGDAASFLDPLSAHGLHKAMEGALAAAAAVRTLLEHPERVSDVMEFYERREAEIVRITRERVGNLYRQEERFAENPFWRARSSGADSVSAPPRAERRRLPEGAVLRPAPEVAVREAPVLENDLIARREVLTAPLAERPVRFLGEVCLVDLFKEVAAGAGAHEAARRSPHGFDRAFAAIEWLYRSGYLERCKGTEL